MQLASSERAHSDCATHRRITTSAARTASDAIRINHTLYVCACFDGLYRPKNGHSVDHKTRHRRTSIAASAAASSSSSSICQVECARNIITFLIYVPHDDAHAATRQTQRKQSAQTAAAAGHQCDLAGQILLRVADDRVVDGLPK